jgi:hypothetical protein
MAEKDDNKHLAWIEQLKELQESDRDQRLQALESDAFLLEKDGQWEDSVVRNMQGRPRYTFDKITPVIETMMADIENMDFGCNVKPAGGEANKKVADTLEGLIRNIQNMSNSAALFRKTCRRLMRRGFDAWIVKSKYADPWSFEQDLFIEAIPNAVRRVWVSNTCVNEDSSDADVAYVLTSLSPADYEKQFPDGKKVSVDDGLDLDDWNSDYKPKVITIAERYYPMEEEVEVAQLSNGDVVRLDEKWAMIQDEQARRGITIIKTKKVKDFVWYHCTFDGGGILTKPIPTVHKSNPVITLYGNHEIVGENSKVTYSGIVLKGMDAQRVHNYAKSREIEEGALAPRSKIMMTKKQAQGHENQIARMNVSPDPVQFYNPDPEASPPYQVGGPQINPHLANLGNQMGIDIKEQANVFDAMQGQFAGRQSEETVRMQIDRGTGATRKWVNALVNGIQRACGLLIEAIPEVYDTKRQVSIVGVDGTDQLVTLNEEDYDQQTGQLVKMNNLNAGKYKVVCEAGAAFTNRLEAGLAAMLEYAAIDPSLVQTGGDLMLKSIDAPLVDELAERKRAQLLQAGMIPVDQMTDEEKQIMQAQAQQPQQPDANMVLAQAEMAKANADLQKAKNDQDRLTLEMAKLEQSGRKVGIDEAKAIADIQNTNADTLKKEVEAEKIAGESLNNQLNTMNSIIQ